MLELDIIIPENYILPLENHLVYVPGSATAIVYVSGNSFVRLTITICFNFKGDVAGPIFWQGTDVTLTSDNLIYRTVAAAEGALLGFATMVYNIIYLRQGHGGRGFDQNKLYALLERVNIGKFSSFLISQTITIRYRLEYVRLMAFYFDDQTDMGKHDGAFSNFGWKNGTSVW